MSVSNNSVKTICENYITIDNDGCIDFKSPFKEEIEKNNILKDEALFILLYLINLIRHNPDYKSDFERALFLIDVFKGAKWRGKNLFKSSDRFNKCYNVEIQIVIDYLFSLARNPDIEIKNFPNQPNLNNNINKKSLKKYFDDFSTDELCYLLDLNPDLNFLKDKVLKNKVIDELLEKPFDIGKLNKNSLDYIKNIINSENQNQSLTIEEIVSNQNFHLFKLKNQFEKRHEEELRIEELQRKKEEQQRLEEERRRKLEELRRKEAEEQRRLEEERIKKIHELKMREMEEERRLEEERRKQYEELRKKKEKLKKLEEIKKKRQLDSIIKQIKLFNCKTISEMILLEEQYSEIYKKIINNSSYFIEDNEILLFKKYFSSLDEMKQINSVIQEIEKNNSLTDFKEDLMKKGFLNYSRRQELIKKYEFSFNAILKMDNFSDFLMEKVYNDFEYLINFKETYEDLKNYKDLSDEKPNRIKKLNEKILDDEIKENPEFFKDISDQNKKRAIVIDEKNVKVNAGAGTGKTFTIQNKVNYLIEKRGVSPKKILCLCYTSAGAEDLNKKVNKNRDEENQVEACTFHEFCRRVARKCGIFKGKTNRKLLRDVIINYSMELDDDEKLTKLIDYFSYYINSPADRGDINTYEELLDYENERDLKTLRKKFYESGANYTMKGETVDSIGELIIANYLFRHNIDYVYGQEYKSPLVFTVQSFLYSGNSFSLISPELQKEWLNKFISKYQWETYVPDFYLPENDIYLEHFGIGHSDNEKWLGKDYEPQIQRKIKYHELHQTKLIKTYYCYLEDGILEEKLEEILRVNEVTIGQKDPKEILDVLRKTNKAEDFDNFNKLIESFINIFEAQNKEKNQFNVFRKINETESDGYKKNRQKLFLDIVSDIYDIYYGSNEGERIDNNREVSLALELIQTKKYSGDYDYILIDEYQDINPIRSLLLQSLQEITNANFFVVGDDWQSIYKFTGSDLSLFLDIDRYFPNSELIKLEENRRNHERLIEISSDFIMRNEKQEKKKLKSIKPNELNPNPIKIVKYSVNPKRNKVLKLYSIIIRLIHKNPKKDKTRILLLGRNNNDIKEFTNNNSIFQSFSYTNKIKCLIRPLDITFMTIHKSKGLQFDEVIVLNFKDELNGFPNKIEDDSILDFLKDKEQCPYAEERRLLYVALTRTFNNVYLLAPVQEESIFIDELVEKYKIKRSGIIINKNLDQNFYKHISNGPFDCKKTGIPCPNCEDGKITVVRNNKTGKQYIRCSNHPVPDPSHYNGGPYWGNLEDYIFLEKCPDPNCEGVLIKDFDKDRLICSLNQETGCKQTKKIDILDYYKDED